MSDDENNELADAEFLEDFVDFMRKREENPEDHDNLIENMVKEEEDFYNSSVHDAYVEGEDCDLYDDGHTFQFDDNELEEIVNDMFAETENHTEVLSQAPRLGNNLQGHSPGVDRVVQSAERGVTNIESFTKADVSSKASWLAKLTPLGKFYEIAKALAETHTYIESKTDDSDTNQLLRALQKVVDALKKVDDSITQGFGDLIAADYARDFKNNIQANVDILYGQLIRCFEQPYPITKDEFMETCELPKSDPAKLISRMFTELAGEENIIKKQLQANHYAYKTYKGWYETIWLNMTRLMICNMFYYAWNTDDSKEGRFCNSEAKHMIRRASEMLDRLKDIEKERMKTFHEDGHAGKLLLEKFNEIVGPYRGEYADWGTEYLPGAAQSLRKESGFYLAVLRGYNIETGCAYNDCEFNVGDKSRTTILKNAAHSGRCFSNAGYDGVNVVLVQPVTAEMVSAHKAKYDDKEMQNQIKKIMEEAFHGRSSLRYRFDKVEGRLLKLMGESTPLLMMFNTDLYTAHHTTKPEFVNYAYRMVGESSTTKEELKTLKIDIHQHTFAPQIGSNIRALLQIIFQ